MSLKRQDERNSALWGGKAGDSRGSALWGKSGRKVGAALVGAVACALVVPLNAVGRPQAPPGLKGSGSTNLYITASLLQQAQAGQDSTFQVIVQGDGSSSADRLARKIGNWLGDTNPITAQFSSISGVAATLTGKQILKLVQHGTKDGLLSITPDAVLQASGSVSGWSSTQLWPYESRTSGAWQQDASINPSAMPSIAIVDSGIQSDRPDFGGRVVGSVNLSTLPGNTAAGDQRGHGTFVAGIAADSLPGVTGADPIANLVDVKVLDSTGMGRTSDIINACQWILANKAKYNIRVANFSLHSSITAPFYIDPLDRAVEQLWFNGIVVVAAAGNYGSSAGPSGVLFSPGDDPFVITVGATDINGSVTPNKAGVAPFSAWGYTIDGFAKPEISAPGRYMIGPVPADATLISEKPGNVTSPGYMQLSGTSFAAPVVSGAAATLLALHPGYTPDQVKGALMLTAKGLTTVGGAGGVGTVQVGALFKPFAGNPPNPNLALDSFVVPTTNSDGTTSTAFDSASWNSAVQANASWNDASWNDASWNDASWNDASWDSVSWNDASWNDASWNDVSWNDALTREDAAEGDATADTSQVSLDSMDVVALLADPSFDPTTLPPWLQPPQLGP